MNSKSKSLDCNQCGCIPCKCTIDVNDKSCCHGHEHRWDCDIECML